MILNVVTLTEKLGVLNFIINNIFKSIFLICFLLNIHLQFATLHTLLTHTICIHVYVAKQDHSKKPAAKITDAKVTFIFLRDGYFEMRSFHLIAINILNNFKFIHLKVFLQYIANFIKKNPSSSFTKNSLII